MAVQGKNRQFPTAYKIKAVKRVERGDGVLPVARELGISRKVLHDWIKAWKADGPDGLNRKRGPKPGPRKLKPPATHSDKRSALILAKTHFGDSALNSKRQRDRGAGLEFALSIEKPSVSAHLSQAPRRSSSSSPPRQASPAPCP